MALGMEVGLGPGHIVLDGDPAPLPKKGTEPPPIFGPSIVAKRLDASRCHLVWSGLRAIANCDFHPERFAEFMSLRIAQTVPVFMPAGAYSRSTCGFFDVAMVNNFFLVNKMMLKCLD